MSTVQEARLALISPELIASILQTDEQTVIAALRQLAQRGEVWRVEHDLGAMWLYTCGNGEFVARDLFDAVSALKKGKIS